MAGEADPVDASGERLVARFIRRDDKDEAAPS